MFNSQFSEFSERHGRCVRHPDRRRLFVFEDGSQYLEPTDSGLPPVMEEPSPDVVQRLFIQREFYRVLSKQRESRFNEAEQHRNVGLMQTVAAELKVARARFKEVDAQWRERTAGARSEAEQRSAEAVEREHRRQVAAQAEKQHMERIESQFKSVSESLRAEIAQV